MTQQAGPALHHLTFVLPFLQAFKLQKVLCPITMPQSLAATTAVPEERSSIRWCTHCCWHQHQPSLHVVFPFFATHGPDGGRVHPVLRRGHPRRAGLRHGATRLPLKLLRPSTSNILLPPLYNHTSQLRFPIPILPFTPGGGVVPAATQPTLAVPATTNTLQH
uniref:Uncharacterized protein n=1 Tax=Oryza barthii TaxID=65489 RepID=A0A0D3EKG7_9ORYZ